MRAKNRHASQAKRNLLAKPKRSGIILMVNAMYQWSKSALNVDFCKNLHFQRQNNIMNKNSTLAGYLNLRCEKRGETQVFEVWKMWRNPRRSTLLSAEASKTWTSTLNTRTSRSLIHDWVCFLLMQGVNDMPEIELRFYRHLIIIVKAWM